ncbi:hypothetical protein [Siansivirga zeaxanthinifaciens]|uniref:8-amino-7-oxononanoate synthase n=1 Tax=Siansivirga zeaxanthinifaciens CC-SAMT-1 TaxID=1454006 RepID=A0A0C5W9D0_9FLAO|nr:hypothetical protein [Siansivirga zeaxanthinifaciens]AJR02897.1 8-amino-7-oxononanoate synthase [Siansivirga zeaxanthinifaciens CC-SAMT-1]
MKTFKIYKTVNRLPKLWDGLTAHDIFLQKKYLIALEQASPKNIQFYYIAIFEDETLLGIAIVQRVQLYLKDMFRISKVSCFKDFLKDSVSKIIKGNILVVGNLMHTGQHGIYFNQNKIDFDTFLNLVYEALMALKKDIKSSDKKTIRAVIFKDYFQDDFIHLEKKFFHFKKLQKISVQPNMVLAVNPYWLSFNDYFLSLNKKYKLRYKRARKKLGNIISKELLLEAVLEHENTLYNLYLNVSNNAAFNTFILPKNHFYNLKLALGDQYKVFGYFLDNELVGFYTLILNNNQLETYFLGYDEAHQYPNQLYLNMLYDMLQFGIENKFANIVYARTAMEIKSSVGAKPKPMSVYIKHTNGILNAILKQLFKLMNPKQDWEERHPFKI